MAFKDNGPGGCCCVDPEVECASCSGATPSTVDVDILGVVNDECSNSDCPGIDGSYTLPKISPCQWRLDVPIYGIFRRRNSDPPRFDCSYEYNQMSLAVRVTQAGYLVVGSVLLGYTENYPQFAWSISGPGATGFETVQFSKSWTNPGFFGGYEDCHLWSLTPLSFGAAYRYYGDRDLFNPEPDDISSAGPACEWTISTFNITANFPP